MSGISIALLVFFIIVALLIVGLVLLQNEEGDSLGGLFSGGSNSAFGSRSSAEGAPAETSETQAPAASEGTSTDTNAQ